MSRLEFLQKEGLYRVCIYNLGISDIVVRLRIQAIAQNHARPFQSFDLVERQLLETIQLFEPEE
jgi:hypothetical protein